MILSKQKGNVPRGGERKGERVRGKRERESAQQPGEGIFPNARLGAGHEMTNVCSQ